MKAACDCAYTPLPIKTKLEIKLRNHKKEPMAVHVVEHLDRWNNWDIAKNSDAFTVSI